MKKFKQYYSELTKAEKVIYIIQLVISAIAFICWCLWLFNNNNTLILFTGLLLGISLGLSGFIKFDNNKSLSVLCIATGIIILIVFLVKFLQRI
ncbi:MAG: hypothetical protein ACI4IR_09805 [Eubacterium sp.]